MRGRPVKLSPQICIARPDGTRYFISMRAGVPDKGRLHTSHGEAHGGYAVGWFAAGRGRPCPCPRGIHAAARLVRLVLRFSTFVLGCSMRDPLFNVWPSVSLLIGSACSPVTHAMHRWHEKLPVGLIYEHGFAGLDPICGAPDRIHERLSAVLESWGGRRYKEERCAPRPLSLTLTAFFSVLLPLF